VALDSDRLGITRDAAPPLLDPLEQASHRLRPRVQGVGRELLPHVVVAAQRIESFDDLVHVVL